MAERRSRRAGPTDPLARLFREVSGEQPDDASLLRMRRVSAALNLRDNDALWSVLAVLEYYTRLYEAVPERIRQAGAGGVDAARAEARAATESLMAQHREALDRCKATIELAERMTAEHEARYRAIHCALLVVGVRALDRPQPAVAVQFQKIALDARLDPAPAFGAHFFCGSVELLCDELLQQFRVGNITRVFVVAEKITAHVAACCLIYGQADEAHEAAAARIDLGARDRLLADAMRQMKA